MVLAVFLCGDFLDGFVLKLHFAASFKTKSHADKKDIVFVHIKALGRPRDEKEK